MTDWLTRCDDLLPRKTTGKPVPWHEFCSPDAPHLTACAAEWQQRGTFTHHRAALVLIAFRAGWLACCTTIPEVHLGLPVPVLTSANALLGPDGRLAGLAAGERQPMNAHEWWSDVNAFFTPLARSLVALGAREKELWGNPVGLIGTVTARMASGGVPGDLLATATTLRAATSRTDLLTLSGTAENWQTRRRTCCQWWRASGGYCTDCVLQDSPSRR